MVVPLKAKNRAIPLLGIYPGTNVIQKGTCTPVFTAVPFTIAKTGKQPKCPDRGVDKEDVGHTYSGCYPAIKKSKIKPFAADIPYMWNPERNDTSELTKQKETRRLREGTYSCCGAAWGKGVVWEFGMDMYTLLYSKWITNKNPLYSTWNSAQC